MLVDARKVHVPFEYRGTCARAWVGGTAPRRYGLWVGLDYSTILYQSFTIIVKESSLRTRCSGFCARGARVLARRDQSLKRE